MTNKNICIAITQVHKKKQIWTSYRDYRRLWCVRVLLRPLEHNSGVSVAPPRQKFVMYSKYEILEVYNSYSFDGNLHELWSEQFSPHGAYTIFYHTRVENTTFAFLSWERKYGTYGQDMVKKFLNAPLSRRP